MKDSASQPVSDSTLLETTYLDRLIQILPTLDFVMCFGPFVFLLCDFYVVSRLGISLIPYNHIDKGYFLVGMFLVILVCAVISVELRSSALDHDAFASIEVHRGRIELPVFNTTRKLMDCYFRRKKAGQKSPATVGYAILVLVSEFAFGWIVTSAFYISNLRSW